jgi:alpha-beta hydrolase superfamily lysophospholipase
MSNLSAPGLVRRADGALEGVGGIRLHFRTWEAATPRAAIVVVHGLGEHSGRYETFATRMAAFGFSSYAFDLRGHGLSEGRRGHAPNFDILLQDLDRFRREVEGLVDVRVPMFLLGHSMGGLIALRYQEEYNTRFRGGIIVSPWVATAMTVPRWKTSIAPVISKALPALPFSNRIDPALLSHDPDVIEAYAGDPLVHDRITPRLFTEASHAMGLVFQRADRFDDPLLFLLAGDDRIVDARRTHALARAIPSGEVTIKVYPTMYHEVLNERDRMLVYRDIRNWIAARLA